MLAELVERGELPEVAARLPEEPLVVEPVDRIGVYGGEWRFLSPGPSTNYPQLITMGYENLVRWQPDTTAYALDDIITNVAKSVDFDDAGTEYTFTLREGMLWSDGEPFTADDILFWYEDVLLNEELTPGIPTWLGQGDPPVRVEKLDQHTVRFVFTEPNGLFLHNLASPNGDSVTGRPAHYLQQFHTGYNDEAEQVAADEGFDSWVDRFQQKASWFENPERPVLIAWQLNVLMLGLNMTHKDPVLAEVFSNQDFRIGLSHAINRPEIIDLVYQQQGEPWQGAPRPESPFHNEELAKQYTEHDVDLANEYLDRAGFTERNADGVRLGPDGKAISLAVEVIIDEVAAIDTLELISDQWKEVGVSMRVKTSERSLWTARKDANDHDAAVWIGDGGLDLIVLPRWYAPMDTWGSLYGLPWAFWYTSGGEDGEEPPEPAKRQMELYDQIRGTANQDEQMALMTELLQIAQEEFWALGVNLTPKGYGIVKNNFHNVPDVIQQGWTYPNQAPTNPEQYFIE